MHGEKTHDPSFILIDIIVAFCNFGSFSCNRDAKWKEPSWACWGGQTPIEGESPSWHDMGGGGLGHIFFWHFLASFTYGIGVPSARPSTRPTSGVKSKKKKKKQPIKGGGGKAPPPLRHLHYGIGVPSAHQTKTKNKKKIGWKKGGGGPNRPLIAKTTCIV